MSLIPLPPLPCLCRQHHPGHPQHHQIFRLRHPRPLTYRLRPHHLHVIYHRLLLLIDGQTTTQTCLPLPDLWYMMKLDHSSLGHTPVRNPFLFIKPTLTVNSWSSCYHILTRHSVKGPEAQNNSITTCTTFAILSFYPLLFVCPTVTSAPFLTSASNVYCSLHNSLRNRRVFPGRSLGLLTFLTLKFGDTVLLGSVVMSFALDEHPCPSTISQTQ